MSHLRGVRVTVTVTVKVGFGVCIEVVLRINFALPSTSLIMPLHVAAHLQHPAAFSTITARFGSNRRKRLTHADTLRCAQSARNEVDVAIVGGGPGGLTAAAAIASALGDDVRIKVKV